MLRRHITGPAGVRFKVFSDDQAINPETETKVTGLEMQIIAMAPGAISYKES